ncbi:MAG: DsbC family protein [Comamonadaceae bacterium]|nr:MAG: DsbC family protein [Comamonadaceae bacterium]
MKLLKTLLLLAIAVAGLGAHAQEATIRKALADRIPALAKIDEISKSPMPGLYEVRFNGSEILYTDEGGNFILQGNLIDTKQRRNLTEERVEKLTAVSFDDLPFKDSFTIVRGNGKRKIAVFEDPNCGYCKRFERDLQKVDNVTIHMFLIPILGRDSPEKSKNVLCSKDKAKAWSDMMVRDINAPVATCGEAAAIMARNMEFAGKYKINGTPTLIFADGHRVPGAINAQQVEKFLADAK